MTRVKRLVMIDAFGPWFAPFTDVARRRNAGWIREDVVSVCPECGKVRGLK